MADYHTWMFMILLSHGTDTLSYICTSFGTFNTTSKVTECCYDCSLGCHLSAGSCVQGEDLVIHLLGDCVMHLLTRLLMPEPPPPKPPSRPPSPNVAPLAPNRRASPTGRSRKSPSPSAKDKKEGKKEKEGESE